MRVTLTELLLHQFLFNDMRNSHYYERARYKINTLTAKKVAQQIHKKTGGAYRLFCDKKCLAPIRVALPETIFFTGGPILAPSPASSSRA